jgi:16S rRNA (guanine527-N7)-methyltransferase
VDADAETTLTRLRRYAQLVIEWNRTVSNLISKNDESRIVARHLVESIQPAAWLKSSNLDRWIDFGSGAGFPAIPQAMIGVGASWTLVESRRPKVLFLRKAIQELDLKNVTVVHSRLEALADEPEHRGAYDGFTSRATMTLGPTLELAADFLRSGGAAFLWKGSSHPEELAAGADWHDRWTTDGALTVGDGQSVVLKFLKNNKVQ